MLKKKSILLTGGAGYIGSHTCLQLLEQGFQVTVIDNLSNSNNIALQRVTNLTGQKIDFLQLDIRDRSGLENLFARQRFDAVIHFAGLKAVGESVANPLAYYENNVTGTINLLQAMQKAEVRTLVFSSSATVYGDPECLPIKEDARLYVTNPYGRSKLIIEEMLADLYKADSRWKIARLRYFNPVGAHSSGLIGENPSGVPNNLLPYISQVACGIREALQVFGADYSTPDGTGVRDYIHVMDLAAGHLSALNYLDKFEHGELLTVNLGTGVGVSVLEMLKSFERASGRSIPYHIQGRRPGDIASCYADASLAYQLLGWKAQLGVHAMCEDAWRWQSGNPSGYEG